MKLNKEKLRQIKALAQGNDGDAMIALLDHHISSALEILVETTTDHRFIQGKLKALTILRDDIVSKDGQKRS